MRALLLGLCMGAAGGALAQPASQVTPSTFEPENQRTTGPIVVSGPAGADVPEGADQLFIQLGAVEIEDALPQMAAANDAFRNRLLGKTIAASEIFYATADLEAAYARRGFVLARVVLPEQRISDGGTLRVVVINGFVESIDASGAPEAVRRRIEALTSPLIGRRALNLRDLERSLLLAGDVYGVSLGSAISAGNQQGGTLVVLGGEFEPVTGFVGTDNLLASNLGPFALNVGVELNGLLEQGETIYARASGNQDFFSDRPRYRVLAAGAVFPIGDDGLTFNFEATSSRTTPDNPLVPTTSSFDRVSLRLFYPWIRSRRYNLSSQLILDRQSDEQFLTAGGGKVPIYKDETTVLRASLDGNWTSEEGAFLDWGVIVSQGLDALGARRAPAAGTPLSRQGADAVFTKLVLAARYSRRLGESVVMSLNARAQTGFGDPLVNGEQLSIAGPRELSAFDAGAVRGDDGWVARAEFSMPQDVVLGTLPFQLSPYVFGAYGVVDLQQPTIFEQAKVKASAYGIGLEIATLGEDQFAAGSVRIEFGRGERDDNRPDDTRFSIVANYRF